MERTTSLVLAILLASSAAFASAVHTQRADADADTLWLAASGLTYATFEHTVAHVDLETCPTGFDDAAVFCRMTLANDMAHVFVFSHEDDQPLVAVRSMEIGEAMTGF